MMKGKGWRNEPLRHSLARKGVRTGRKTKSSFKLGNVRTIKGKTYILKKEDVIIAGTESNEDYNKYIKKLEREGSIIVSTEVKELKEGSHVIITIKYLNKI